LSSQLASLAGAKWSEPIIVLGKGTPNFIEKYGCSMQCVAGIGEASGWLRLYPVFVCPTLPRVAPVEKFDVIQTVFRVRRPEPLRPESRKIHPELVRKVDCITGEQRRSILLEHTESGDFLHDDSWQGRKSLGLIEPKNSRFRVTADNIPKVEFRCNSRRCRRHHMDLFELIDFDEFGRTYPQRKKPRDQVEMQLSRLEGKELRFVMGTVYKHPQRWIIVAVHALNGHK